MSATPTPVRILIADDHPVVRAGLVAMIEAEPADNMAIVGEAKDGQEALDLFEKLRPDITLMDLRMSRMDGADATAAIRQLDSLARVILLTTYDTDEDVYRGLRAGAKAYLLKDAPRELLIECINSVVAGRAYLPAQVAIRVAERMSQPGLTTREMDVLRLMALGRSNKEIGSTLFVSEGTVKTHVKAILTKLGAISRTEAVTIGNRRGLLKP